MITMGFQLPLFTPWYLVLIILHEFVFTKSRTFHFISMYMSCITNTFHYNGRFKRNLLICIVFTLISILHSVVWWRIFSSGQSDFLSHVSPVIGDLILMVDIFAFLCWLIARAHILWSVDPDRGYFASLELGNKWIDKNQIGFLFLDKYISDIYDRNPTNSVS